MEKSVTKMINLIIYHIKQEYIKLCGGDWLVVGFPDFPEDETRFISDPFGCTDESLRKAEELFGEKAKAHYKYNPDSNVWTYIDDDTSKANDNQGDNSQSASIIEELNDRLN